MAYKLMIQGTMSSAGKSFIVTALCRLFSDMGYRVAPFKSQNMALNSGVTFDGLEMGRAQIAQAEAARTVPDARMNPILLKPSSDVGSQVIVMGKPIGNMKAKEYYDYKPCLIPIIKEAFSSLEKDYDVIIVEGAGSPAEINLKENDIVNMGLANMLDLPVLLVGDIDLGGVFAQLLGTLEWLDDDEKARIKGLIINKFRGDVSLLNPGIKMLEDRCKKTVIGVIPYSKALIDEEDSVTRKLEEPNTNIETETEIIIDVIRLPHMSNFTDFTPLERVSGVSVRYIHEVPLVDSDLIIIPGTKNTISDLSWIKKNGIYDYLCDKRGLIPVMGICGGNQMLGSSIVDPKGIETDDKSLNSICEGLHFINQTTVMSEEKTLRKVSGRIACKAGFFKCLDGTEFEGYEIHSGVTERITESCDDVFGTYVHGIFDKAEVTGALINELRMKKHLPIIDSEIFDYSNIKDIEYDKAAESVRENIDLKKLFSIMGISYEE